MPGQGVTAHEAAGNLRWHYCLAEPCEWLAIWIGPHRHLLKDDGRIGIMVERLTSEDIARTSAERIQAYGRGELLAQHQSPLSLPASQASSALSPPWWSR